MGSNALSVDIVESRRTALIVDRGRTICTGRAETCQTVVVDTVGHKFLAVASSAEALALGAFFEVNAGTIFELVAIFALSAGTRVVVKCLAVGRLLETNSKHVYFVTPACWF